MVCDKYVFVVMTLLFKRRSRFLRRPFSKRISLMAQRCTFILFKEEYNTHLLHPSVQKLSALTCQFF